MRRKFVFSWVQGLVLASLIIGLSAITLAWRSRTANTFDYRSERGISFSCVRTGRSVNGIPIYKLTVANHSKRFCAFIDHPYYLNLYAIKDGVESESLGLSGMIDYARPSLRNLRILGPNDSLTQEIKVFRLSEAQADHAVIRPDYQAPRSYEKILDSSTVKKLKDLRVDLL